MTQRGVTNWPNRGVPNWPHWGVTNWTQRGSLLPLLPEHLQGGAPFHVVLPQDTRAVRGPPRQVQGICTMQSWSGGRGPCTPRRRSGRWRPCSRRQPRTPAGHAKCFARIILQYVPEGSGSWKYNHFFSSSRRQRENVRLHWKRRRQMKRDEMNICVK